MKGNSECGDAARTTISFRFGLTVLVFLSTSLFVHGQSPQHHARGNPIRDAKSLSKVQEEIQARMYDLSEQWYNLSFIRNSEPPRTDRSDPYMNTAPGFACRETEVDVADDVDSFPLFSSVPPNVYPGSIIKGNTLLTATYGVFSGDRNSAKIVIDAPWIDDKNGGGVIGTEEMQPISQAQYLEAYRRVLKKGIHVPANIAFHIARIYNMDQLKFMMEADVSGDNFDVGLQFKVDSKSSSQYALISVDQKFFRMYLDRPPFGAELFAKEMSRTELDMILKEMTGTNPPLYLSAMDYGRKAYVLFESQDSSLDIQTTLNAAYRSAVELKGEMSLEVKKAMESMSANGFIIGGSATLGGNALSKLFGGDKAGGLAALEGIKKWLEEGAEPTEQNPPAALGYEFSLLLDGSKALARTLTNYKEVDCKVGVCPSGFYWGKKFGSTWFEISPERDPQIAPAAAQVDDVVRIQDGSFYTYDFPNCNRIYWRNIALKCVKNQRSDFVPAMSPPGVWTWLDLVDEGAPKHVVGTDGWCADSNDYQTNMGARRLNVNGAPPIPLLDGKDEGPAANPEVYWKWK